MPMKLARRAVADEARAPSEDIGGAAGAARRPGAHRPRLRAAPSGRRLGSHPQGLRDHPGHHLARRAGRDGARRRARTMPSLRSAMPAGTPGSSSARCSTTPGCRCRSMSGWCSSCPSRSAGRPPGSCSACDARPRQPHRRSCLSARAPRRPRLRLRTAPHRHRRRRHPQPHRRAALRAVAAQAGTRLARDRARAAALSAPSAGGRRPV